MTTTGVPQRSRQQRPPPVRRRLGSAVLASATALGLLFGLTAPSVSPVTPTPPNITAVNAVVPADTVPDDPVGQPDGRQRGGNRR